MSSSDPYRAHIDGKDINWKSGTPNYSTVNDLYARTKSKNHPENSLEDTVEKLVKTMEMEMQHKLDPKQWQTISDPATFTIRTNDGRAFTADEMVRVGSYWVFLDKNPHFHKDQMKIAKAKGTEWAPSACPFEKGEISQKIQDVFECVFTEGFAFEVLKVHTGPPTVTFTWRHWGPFTGVYHGRRGNGETVTLYGMSVSQLDDKLKLLEVQSYFDTATFFHVLESNGK